MINKKANAQIDTNLTSENDNTAKTKTPHTGFPIIAIGASAGGLEALKLFLENVPAKSGMAFVVVQHLDPTRKGFLVDLLKRATAMQVFQVKDSIFVQPDCVYIIPPNKDMQLFHGALHLFDPVEPRGLRLPVDFLFRSMADDRREEGIGVILSGMGSDGTLGLKAIKEKGGAVFVQEPNQAKFNGMPNSAIGTGLADVVALVEELPSKIITYLQHRPLMDKPITEMVDKDRVALEKIVILLRSQTGHDFSLYKETTIFRRIDRRMGIHQIDKIPNYIRFLQENPQELQVLFKELLIGVTNFFRDPEAWKQLKEQVFPELFNRHELNQPIRVWVAGCSTGEEAYSLAIIFKEALEHVKPAVNFSLQIFATDLDRDAIDIARRGLYKANITADVSPDRLKRFFIQEEQGYRVGKEIRDMVIFASQNIIMDPPFTKIDILSCRNLLIYLNPKLQKKLLALFHYSLNPGGFLFLGSSETTGNSNEFFEPLKGRSRFYRGLKSTQVRESLVYSPSVNSVLASASNAVRIPAKAGKLSPNLEDLTNRLILERYSTAAVLVSDKGDILYTRGRTAKYLEPAAGKFNWNIFAMAHKDLYYSLNKAFHKAVRQNITITLKNVIIDTDVGKQALDVTVQPLKESEALRPLVMVFFANIRMLSKTKAPGRTSHVSAHKNRVEELEVELGKVRQDLQNLLRETQASKEECLSAYEELQSTNEELQSTSEEITTSKEEQQSLNEELQSVNYELQTKVDELSQANNDMKNLLDSTEIATLFLDKSLRVRRFTPQTVKVISLIPVDVGRPITDIVSKLNYPELAEDAREVLRKLVLMEKSVTASDGRWFAVRIMPYRTLEDKIDGLVITFTDITESKMLEIALRQTQVELEKRIVDEGTELDKVRILQVKSRG